jgi:chaperone modulatory protein CbpM
MSHTHQPSAGLLAGQIVEEEIELTLTELCYACTAEEKQIAAWVMEGVLEPIGNGPHDWRFAGRSLYRARVALRLTQDLEVNDAGVALALELLDEIARLRASLQRVSAASSLSE